MQNDKASLSPRFDAISDKKGVQKRHTLKHYNALLPTRGAPNFAK